MCVCISSIFLLSLSFFSLALVIYIIHARLEDMYAVERKKGEGKRNKLNTCSYYIARQMLRKRKEFQRMRTFIQSSLEYDNSYHVRPVDSGNG